MENPDLAPALILWQEAEDKSEVEERLNEVVKDGGVWINTYGMTEEEVERIIETVQEWNMKTDTFKCK